MSKNENAQIINKKLLGSKLLYLVLRQNSKKWIDYDQLTELLPQVIDYEKKNNPIFAKENYTNNRLDSNIFNKGNKKDKVKNIEFVDKIKGSLLFKVEYKNGESQYKTNQELKRQNCELLCSFYENNINIYT